MCKQTELWLTLQLITQHSQLLITQHLFCPHSTLFCIHCQPGSLHRIKQRALSNTLLLKRCSSAVLSLAQRYSGDTSAHIFSVLRTQQMVRNVSPLIALISLWGWSVFTQSDDIMTIKWASVLFHSLSGDSLVSALGQFGMQTYIASLINMRCLCSSTTSITWTLAGCDLLFQWGADDTTDAKHTPSHMKANCATDDCTVALNVSIWYHKSCLVIKWRTCIWVFVLPACLKRNYSILFRKS